MNLPHSRPCLLLIDTSTDICSVALAQDDVLLAEEIDDSGERRHAALLPNLIDKLFATTGLHLNDLHAIVYSKGPGSYTGLRVGLSGAKAMCMALNLPLIGVSTLESMAYSYVSADPGVLIIPMIDAGRNEVYHAVYNFQYELYQAASPLLLSPGCFDELLTNCNNILINGDAVNKAQFILGSSDRIEFGQERILAQYLRIPGFKKYFEGSFENVAYSVPDYIKAPNYKKSVQLIDK